MCILVRSFFFGEAKCQSHSLFFPHFKECVCAAAWLGGEGGDGGCLWELTHVRFVVLSVRRAKVESAAAINTSTQTGIAIHHLLKSKCYPLSPKLYIARCVFPVSPSASAVPSCCTSLEVHSSRHFQSINKRVRAIHCLYSLFLGGKNPPPPTHTFLSPPNCLGSKTTPFKIRPLDPSFCTKRARHVYPNLAKKYLGDLAILALYSLLSTPCWQNR